MDAHEAETKSLREMRDEAFIQSLNFVQCRSSEDDEPETPQDIGSFLKEKAVQPPLLTVRMGKRTADIFARALAAYNEFEELDIPLMVVLRQLREFSSFSNREAALASSYL